jgi:hypothetical protein
MAGIRERKNKNGKSTFQVRLRIRKTPTFTINFDKWVDACNWVEKHENLFVENPESYFKWRESIYKTMRQNKQEVNESIIRTFIRKSYAK